jgi:hypothetical protein
MAKSAVWNLWEESFTFSSIFCEFEVWECNLSEFSHTLDIYAGITVELLCICLVSCATGFQYIDIINGLDLGPMRLLRYLRHVLDSQLGDLDYSVLFQDAGAYVHLSRGITLRGSPCSYYLTI